MDINADEHESARSVPVMIPLGKGLWNNIRQGQGYTPAAYTMPTLGTNLALALWTDAAVALCDLVVLRVKQFLEF